MNDKELETHAKLLKKLQADIQVAEHRLTVAETQASNREARNKAILEEMEANARADRQQILRGAEKEHERLLEGNTKLTAIQTGLLDEIEKLNKKITNKNEEYDGIETIVENAKASIVSDQEKLNDLDKQIIARTQELVDIGAKVIQRNGELNKLDIRKQRVEEDIEILDIEADKLQDKIMEQDAQYKARTDDLRGKEKELLIRVQTSADRLIETQNKDKAMREGWADEHQRLEKRTQAVQMMESRLSDTQKRVQELDNYLKL